MASPGEKLPAESAQAAQAWFRYRDDGPDRNLRKTAQDLGKSNAVIMGWSKKHGWPARALAWDGFQDGLRTAAVNRALEKATTNWTLERESQRARELDMGQALIAKAKQMLEWPLAQRRLEQDGKVTIVEPARWRLADAAKMLETGSKLIRLAAEMETDRVTVQVEAARLAAELGIPVEEALAEVEAILAERGVRT